MRQIALTCVLSFSPQVLKTAALESRFGWVPRHKMQVLHSVSQLVHRSDQLSIDSVPGDGSKQKSLVSGNLCRQVQAGRIGHESSVL
jgi:hypothetical protein